MPTETFTHIDQLGNRSPDGMRLGSATTDKIGFYGIATPVAQRAAGSNTALTTGSTTTVQTAVMIEIQTALVALGLLPAT